MPSAAHSPPTLRRRPSSRICPPWITLTRTPKRRTQPPRDGRHNQHCPDCGASPAAQAGHIDPSRCTTTPTGPHRALTPPPGQAGHPAFSTRYASSIASSLTTPSPACPVRLLPAECAHLKTTEQFCSSSCPRSPCLNHNTAPHSLPVEPAPVWIAVHTFNPANLSPTNIQEFARACIVGTDPLCSPHHDRINAVLAGCLVHIYADCVYDLSYFGTRSARRSSCPPSRRTNRTTSSRTYTFSSHFPPYAAHPRDVHLGGTGTHRDRCRACPRSSLRHSS